MQVSLLAQVGPRETLTAYPSPWWGLIGLGVAILAGVISWRSVRDRWEGVTLPLLVSLAIAVVAGLVTVRLIGVDGYGFGFGGLVFFGLQIGFIVFLVWALLRIIRGLDELKEALLRGQGPQGPPPGEDR